METFIKDKLVFKMEVRGLMFHAWYSKELGGDALVEITKDDVLVRRFLLPAYKVWNVVAHADEIVDSLT